MRKIQIFLIFLGVIFLTGCGNSGSVIPTTGSIWKSSDGGKTWEVKNIANENTVLPKYDVLSFVFSPNDANSFFVGTKDGALIRTIDGANSWNKLDFQSPKIYGLDVDPNNGSIIYASGVANKRGRLFKTFDIGENWKQIFTFPAEGPLITNLVVDKKNPKIIYISTSDNQVIKSYDAGETWQNIFDTKKPIAKIFIDSQNNSLIYLFDVNGDIFRSRDAGENFEKIDGNIEGNRGISVIEVDPSNEGWIYAGGRSGLFISKDAGETWEEIPTTFNKSRSYPISAIAINPSNSREMIYGSNFATYKSVDGGENWITSYFEGEREVKVIEYNPKNTQEVYVGFSD